jgi:hypothetical protein
MTAFIGTFDTAHEYMGKPEGKEATRKTKT